MIPLNFCVFVLLCLTLVTNALPQKNQGSPQEVNEAVHRHTWADVEGRIVPDTSVVIDTDIDPQPAVGRKAVNKRKTQNECSGEFDGWDHIASFCKSSTSYLTICARPISGETTNHPHSARFKGPNRTPYIEIGQIQLNCSPGMTCSNHSTRYRDDNARHLFAGCVSETLPGNRRENAEHPFPNPADYRTTFDRKKRSTKRSIRLLDDAKGIARFRSNAVLRKEGIAAEFTEGSLASHHKPGSDGSTNPATNQTETREVLCEEEESQVVGGRAAAGINQNESNVIKNSRHVNAQTLLIPNPPTLKLEKNKELLSSQNSLIRKRGRIPGHYATHCGYEHDKWEFVQSACFGSNPRAYVVICKEPAPYWEMAPQFHRYDQCPDDEVCLNGHKHGPSLPPGLENFSHLVARCVPIGTPVELLRENGLNQSNSGLSTLSTPSTSLAPASSPFGSSTPYVPDVSSVSKPLYALEERTPSHSLFTRSVPSRGGIEDVALNKRTLDEEVLSVFGSHSSTTMNICKSDFSGWLFVESWCEPEKSRMYSIKCSEPVELWDIPREEISHHRCPQDTICQSTSVGMDKRHSRKGLQHLAMLGLEHASVKGLENFTYMVATCVPTEIARRKLRGEAEPTAPQWQVTPPTAVKSENAERKERQPIRKRPLRRTKSGSEEVQTAVALKNPNQKLDDQSTTKDEEQSIAADKNKEPIEAILPRGSPLYSRPGDDTGHPKPVQRAVDEIKSNWPRCIGDYVQWFVAGQQCSQTDAQEYIVHCRSPPSQLPPQYISQRINCPSGTYCIDVESGPVPSGLAREHLFLATCVPHDTWVDHSNPGLQRSLQFQSGSQQRHILPRGNPSSSRLGYNPGRQTPVQNTVHKSHWPWCKFGELSHWVAVATHCSPTFGEEYLVRCRSPPSQQPSQEILQRYKCRLGTYCVDMKLTALSSGSAREFPYTPRCVSDEISFKHFNAGLQSHLQLHKDWNANNAMQSHREHQRRDLLPRAGPSSSRPLDDTEKQKSGRKIVDVNSWPRCYGQYSDWFIVAKHCSTAHGQEFFYRCRSPPSQRPMQEILQKSKCPSGTYCVDYELPPFPNGVAREFPYNARCVPMEAWVNYFNTGLQRSIQFQKGYQQRHIQPRGDPSSSTAPADSPGKPKPVKKPVALDDWPRCIGQYSDWFAVGTHCSKTNRREYLFRCRSPPPQQPPQYIFQTGICQPHTYCIDVKFTPLPFGLGREVSGHTKCVSREEWVEDRNARFLRSLQFQKDLNDRRNKNISVGNQTNTSEAPLQTDADLRKRKLRPELLELRRLIDTCPMPFQHWSVIASSCNKSSTDKREFRVWCTSDPTSYGAPNQHFEGSCALNEVCASDVVKGRIDDFRGVSMKIAACYNVEKLHRVASIALKQSRGSSASLSDAGSASGTVSSLEEPDIHESLASLHISEKSEATDSKTQSDPADAEDPTTSQAADHPNAVSQSRRITARAQPPPPNPYSSLPSTPGDTSAAESFSSSLEAQGWNSPDDEEARAEAAAHVAALRRLRGDSAGSLEGARAGGARVARAGGAGRSTAGWSGAGPSGARRSSAGWGGAGWSGAGRSSAEPSRGEAGSGGAGPSQGEAGPSGQTGEAGPSRQAGEAGEMHEWGLHPLRSQGSSLDRPPVALPLHPPSAAERRKAWVQKQKGRFLGSFKKKPPPGA